ncbi:hypothetical protein Tco_0205307 [Tanacetum coccineum]
MNIYKMPLENFKQYTNFEYSFLLNGTNSLLMLSFGQRLAYYNVDTDSCSQLNKMNAMQGSSIDSLNALSDLLALVVISQVHSTTRTFTPGVSGNNSGKQKIVTYYNYKGERHMSKQCTKPKRKRDDSWFKDKVLLVQAQASGKFLHEVELAFLADLGILEAQAT